MPSIFNSTLMTSLADLSSAEIAKAVRLAKKKETLKKELVRIDAELTALGTGTKAASPTAPKRRGRPVGSGKKPGRKPGRKPAVKKVVAKKPVAKKAPVKKVAVKEAPVKKAAPAKASTRKRGDMKGKILKALKDAGAKGVSVKDISTALKVKPANVHSWFQTTGKKMPGIKKIGKALYTITG